MVRRTLSIWLLFILFSWSSMKAAEARTDTVTSHCLTPAVQLPRDQSSIEDSLVIIQNKATIGSGIIVSHNGYILTAAHVVAPAKQVAVYMYDGDVLTGQVLHIDEQHDAALIKISGTALPCRPLQTQNPTINAKIYSAGLSFDSHHILYQLTVGYIVGIQQGFLQTSTSPVLGNSGGPFLNSRGEVIGLIGWKAQPLNQNLTAGDTNSSKANSLSYGASASTLQKILKPFLASNYPTG